MTQNPPIIGPYSRPFWKTRADGWPLCPCCEEDELFSQLHWNGKGERPPMQAWIDAGLRCYQCGWDSERHTAIGSVSSAIAAAIIQQSLDEGKDVTIPSLDIVIPGRKHE